MKVKIFKNNALDRQIKSAILLSDSDKQLHIYSDYGFDVTCAILKLFVDSTLTEVEEVDSLDEVL